MTGRIVLGPSPDAGPPHRCHGLPKVEPRDSSMVGAVWRCDECGQYWLNRWLGLRWLGLGGLWDKILPEQARQLIDAHPERIPT